MQDITDTLRQGTGQAGGSQWLTLQQLADNNIIEIEPGIGGGLTPGGAGTGPGAIVRPKPDIDASPPPAPYNVRTSGSPTAIRIMWDDPALNYSYRAEVWIGTENDVGQATLAGSSNGTIYEHIMGSDTSQQLFWVRFVKGNGRQTIIGPWNSTTGTPGQVAGELVDAQLGTLDVDKLIGGKAEFVSANILDGSITNAKIGDTIQSNNYQPGVQGWIIKK